MIDRFREFFARAMAPPEGPEPGDADRRVRVAACALLLELAYADDRFTDQERRHLEGALRRHFDLGEEEARELLELARRERDEAVDLWRFTSLVREHYSLGQRLLLAEIMWGLVMADGELAGRESYLLRKIANLLDVKPGYLAEARRRAEDRGRPEID